VYEIFHYLTSDGVDVFDTWLDTLADAKAVARIVARIDRVQAGNLGDHKSVGHGVWELRIDHGPGYRVYYALAGRRIVLLLCGGDKRKQAADIRRAVLFLKDYNERGPKR
jgi:putative addiction module killer protein